VKNSIKYTMRKVAYVAFAPVLLLTSIGLSGCVSDADQTSQNLSTEAEQFKVQRRIVFYNGITDSYIFEVEGKCSVEPGDYLEVICKYGPDDYRKHFLGGSDNVTWFVEQLEGVDVSEYHTEIIWKPESVVPTVNLETKAEDGPGH
jgi:hypothetical protein